MAFAKSVPAWCALAVLGLTACDLFEAKGPEPGVYVSTGIANRDTVLLSYQGSYVFRTSLHECRLREQRGKWTANDHRMTFTESVARQRASSCSGAADWTLWERYPDQNLTLELRDDGFWITFPGNRTPAYSVSSRMSQDTSANTIGSGSFIVTVPVTNYAGHRIFYQRQE